jgi:hypothetical protein
VRTPITIPKLHQQITQFCNRSNLCQLAIVIGFVRRRQVSANQLGRTMLQRPKKFELITKFLETLLYCRSVQKIDC